ncbi:hypothetical protein [Devosia ginsengisoli]|uniref:hypothetical protein n=1 Tax=Devosia ginsengisoli TaxID=400770 RepID=UPI0026EE4367|nr:hypothetical protein [Devosia ginsengisoli]MCR6673291.1 hypothetical protein [Devosia ginsengisoli]
MNEHNDINRKIGIRLAALMASRNVQRAAIINALGITNLHLRKIENGIKPMMASEMVLAAKALGITSSVLTGEEPFKAGEAP